MKRQLSPGTAVALCLLTATATANITAAACRIGFNNAMPSAEAQKLYSKLGEIQRIIDKNYVGEYDQQEMTDTAAAGLVVGMGDRWSGYMPREQYQEYALGFDGKLVGIGISVVMAQDDKSIVITDVYDDSPAEKAGLLPRDEIIGAGTKTVERDGYTAVVAEIKGKEGAKATLTVQRQETSETETITIARKTVEKTGVRGRMLEDNIGYIVIHDFDGGVDGQFQTALDDLIAQGAQKLIFDVRWNPGGSVLVLDHMLDPLLPEGPVITLTPKEGESAAYFSDAAALDLPMAVLVNAESISAAEFFAAALQEYGKAVVVGDQTIGKGYSQRQYKLSDGSALILSDQKYYTPKGKNLADIGIRPDIKVSLSDEDYANHYFLTDAQDTQLQAAMKAVGEQ